MNIYFGKKPVLALINTGNPKGKKMVEQKREDCGAKTVYRKGREQRNLPQ